MNRRRHQGAKRGEGEKKNKNAGNSDDAENARMPKSIRFEGHNLGVAQSGKRKTRKTSRRWEKGGLERGRGTQSFEEKEGNESAIRLGLSKGKHENFRNHHMGK